MRSSDLKCVHDAQLGFTLRFKVPITTPGVYTITLQHPGRRRNTAAQRLTITIVPQVSPSATPELRSCTTNAD
jgi:hypothetical protein